MTTESRTSPDGNEYRRQLYEVMADPDLTFPEKRDHVLRLGKEYLGVANGHVERIEAGGEAHEIVGTTGLEETLPDGAVLEQSKTYCSRTIEQDSLLAVTDAEADGLGDVAAYEEWGIACYLGAPITVDGDVWGTVCFVSEDARDREFAPDERAFVELVATVFGRELESRRHERELDERERRLDERERALRRSEAKYESLLDAAPDAVFLIDLGSGEIVEANPAAAELTGYDQGALEGMPVEEVHPPAEHERYRAEFERFVATGGTRSQTADGDQFYVRRADGTDVPVEISASVVELDGREYLQGIVRDIGDRLERERELRVKNRAIDEADVGVTIADATTPDNDLVYVNEQFAAMTGYERTEIEGRNCRILQGPDTEGDAVGTLREGVAAEESVGTELLNYRADGTPFWNEVTVTPVTDGNGETTHFVGFQRDVTRRKRRERLITVLNRVLRHNLRNSAGVVTGLAEEIGETSEGRTARLAGLVADRGWDLASLGDKAATLDTVVHERATPESRDVVPVVAAAVADARREYDADVELSAPDRLDALATDRLSRAVTELVDNAVEHGGSDPSVSVDVESAGEDVRIHVADDGPGLPDNERAVLRLGRETKLDHGNGLGLWLVNWIVTDAGGRVTTSVDDGTTVTIHLPDPDVDAVERRVPAILGT